MEKRVNLDKDKQKTLIYAAANKIGSLKSLAKSLQVPYSTIKNYARGDRLIPENLFYIFIEKAGIPKEELSYTLLPSNWGNIKAGKIGMKALERKYPDEISKWRRRGVRKFTFTNVKKIKEPDINEDLAELFGAYLGDGTLTKYFIRISGDSRYDMPYFNHLNDLFYNLFGVKARISKTSTTNNLYITLNSKKVCDYFNQQLGVQYGDKLRNNTLIPSLFLEKDSLALACLRGLIDTDGCVSLRGQSFSVSFYSKNPNLINQVRLFTDKHSIFTYTSKNKDEIGTNSREKIISYFREVGSSNLRHIVRFNQRFAYGELVYQKEVLSHYRKDLYTNIKLPFKLAAS